MMKPMTKTALLALTVLAAACSTVEYKYVGEAEKKIRQLFLRQHVEGDSSWKFIEDAKGKRRQMTPEEIANHHLLSEGARVYSTISMKPREYRENQDFNFEFSG